MIRAEFTIYPFIEGMALPEYVQVAVDAFADAGLEAQVGPLSQTVEGELHVVLEALRVATEAALAGGAHRVVINVEDLPA
jgi:uncharacterized protein YqgV (UPF0045/DUF77 family)